MYLIYLFGYGVYCVKCFKISLNENKSIIHLSNESFIFYQYFRMFMPKQHRVSIYEYLFKEGVMVAKEDFNAPKHPELETIPNLHVIKTMQSLKSRGYVKQQFAWRHYYWQAKYFYKQMLKFFNKIIFFLGI